MEFKDEHILLRAFLGLGDVQIRYYGIIIVVAMLIAAYLAARLAKRGKLDPDHIWGALTWAIIPGIIAARLWFILVPPISLTAGCADELANTVCKNTAWFFQNFFNLQEGAVAIWSGGLHIFGAFLGGLFGAYLYFSPRHNRIVAILQTFWRPWRAYFIVIGVALIVVWVVNRQALPLIVGIVGIVIGVSAFTPPGRRFLAALSGPEGPAFPDAGVPIAPYLDVAAIALPLAQAVGRWANYVNQELYGLPTSLPWGIPIDSRHRVGIYENTVEYPTLNPTTLFHPLFLYEALWNFLAFIVLLNVFQRYRSRLRSGDMFLLYMAQYSFIRFLLEFLRVEVAYFPGTSINSAQVIAGLAFLVSVGLFLYRHRPGAVEKLPAEQPAADNPTA